MICLLCTLFFLVSGVSIGAVMLCVSGIGFACNFFPVVSYLLETSVSLMGIWSEIMVYVISGLLELLEALIRFGIQISPYISRGCNHLYNSLPYIMNDVYYNINNARENIWHIIQNQKEMLIYCWGLMLVPLYLFQNRISNYYRNGGRNNQNHRGNRHNIPEHEDDLNVDDDNLFRNRANNNDNYDRVNNNEQNYRNRDRNVRQRLYPDLHNDGNDADYSDEEEEGDVNVNNPVNDFQCIVCFDQERNTAIFPCGHTQLCERCVRNVMRRNKRCPVCQRLIAEYRNIFL